MANRGRHRVLLGMAPGVGKTYRMLQEGHEERGAGRDVVIGYLEPHDRAETTALAEGLEMVAPLTVEYGSVSLPEMDLDSVIDRDPDLALVDELAHTNAPGSARPKRYEDVEILLEHGIDVVSTVNVQHLESLNDQVSDITGVRVRETLPDEVLKKADEVVLIDLTPEDLIERLLEGKVYPGQNVEAALNSFFKIENLSALRELSLRQVAEDVESRRSSQVAPRRPGCGRSFSPDRAPPVNQRLLALVTPDPQSNRLIRKAWRSADRSGAELDLLLVAPADELVRIKQSSDFKALDQLASLLGAELILLAGDNLVDALGTVTAERGSTCVYIDAPTVRGLRPRLRPSIVEQLIASLPEVDVHVVGRRGDPTTRTVP